MPELPSKLFISVDPCFVMPMQYCVVIENVKS